MKQTYFEDDKKMMDEFSKALKGDKKHKENYLTRLKATGDGPLKCIILFGRKKLEWKDRIGLNVLIRRFLDSELEYSALAKAPVLSAVKEFMPEKEAKKSIARLLKEMAIREHDGKYLLARDIKELYEDAMSDDDNGGDDGEIPLLGNEIPIDELKPKVSFKSIVLARETRRKLDSAIMQVKRIKQFQKMGISSKSVTLCFSGPPGTGKTLAAEAMAKYLNRTFMVITYSRLSSMWSGETEKNISAVFKHAKENNAVLFFDEADSLAYTRQMASHGWELSQINVMLKELENFEGVCIFATNLKGIFDPAFERRLSLHIDFEKPKEAERLKIWQIHTRKCKLGKGIDLKHLAKHYDFAGGDIKNAVLNAVRLALLEGNVIRQNHLEEACKSVKGKENKERMSYFG